MAYHRISAGNGDHDSLYRLSHGTLFFQKIISDLCFPFFIGCAAAAFSPNIYLLLLARVVQALGAGILLPLPPGCGISALPPEERGTIMGIVGLTTGFAPAFGPTFAGWIADSFGWRSIFYIMCALAALSIVLGIVKLPEEEKHSEGKLDILSVILCNHRLLRSFNWRIQPGDLRLFLTCSLRSSGGGDSVHRAFLPAAAEASLPSS